MDKKNNICASGIGGQAVLEGIMMKNKDKYAVAVRKPDKTIDVDVKTYKGFTSNKKILQYGANEKISLGTTLTAALFTESEYFIVNIGDTRAYEIGAKLKQLTHDHSFVQQEVDCGRMSPEEARISKRKNVLTRCIGAKEDVVPDFFFGKIKKNATYVLCSDGFRHKISEPEMLSYFDSGKHSSSEDLKNTEISLIELNKKRQETDNISVVTIIKK